MLFFTIPIILFMSLLFLRLCHPLSMGVALLFQTCLICLSSGLASQSFWFSYILFLVFLGGMLVLFIYVTSLASNEPFKFSILSNFLLMTAIMTIGLIIVMEISLAPIMVKTAPSMMTSYPSLLLISMIYSLPTMNFTLYVVMYLLLTLFAVVNISSNHFGPLRLST